MLRQVHDALTAAYRVDPTLTYPWREWNEIVALLGISDADIRSNAATANHGPPIGYRRHDARVRVYEEWTAALSTIIFEDPAHRDWAIASHESLQWDEPLQQQTVVVDSAPP